MDLVNLQTILEETFAANFVVYYRAHQAHVNVRGRNFYNDHKLLKGIYSKLQDHIDDLGEKLRTVQSYMPVNLATVIETTPISDDAIDGSSDAILHGVLAGIEVLIEMYHELDRAAQAVEYVDISNMAQDMIGELAKMKWQLQATLDLE